MLYEVPFGIVNESLCLIMLLTAHFQWAHFRIKDDAGPAAWHFGCFNHIIELANPYSGSREASFLAIRVWVPFISCYFIMYSSVQTRKDIDLFLSGWFLLGLISAVYCLNQEFFGTPFVGQSMGNL